MGCGLLGGIRVYSLPIILKAVSSNTCPRSLEARLPPAALARKLCEQG